MAVNSVLIVPVRMLSSRSQEFRTLAQDTQNDSSLHESHYFIYSLSIELKFASL